MYTLSNLTKTYHVDSKPIKANNVLHALARKISYRFVKAAIGGLYNSVALPVPKPGLRCTNIPSTDIIFQQDFSKLPVKWISGHTDEMYIPGRKNSRIFSGIKALTAV